MNKQDWKIVEEKVESFWQKVILKCDGYLVSLRLERFDCYRNVIAVYINGCIKSEWLRECEESRRFFQRKSTSVMTNKEKKDFKKVGLDKRLDINKKIYSYYPWWNSFKALKRHFEKENKSIELIPEDKIMKKFEEGE